MPVTNYVWDTLSDNVLMETDENDVTQAVYTQEPDTFGNLISQRRDDETSWYHFDGLGSTRELTNASESVTDTNMYDAWGVNVASTGTTENPFRWVGKSGYYRDGETNEYNVRSRNYCPAVARWLSMDPIALAFVPLFDVYRYAANQPILLTDPSGAAPPSQSGPLPGTPGSLDPIPLTCCRPLGGFRHNIDRFFHGGLCAERTQTRRIGGKSKATTKVGPAIWDTYIEFSNKFPAFCKCCEYRQWVSGYMYLLYKRPASAPWKTLRRTHIPTAAPIEDCSPVGQKNCKRYGHRSAEQRPNDYYGLSSLSTNRMTACEFHMRDTPGYFFAPSVEGVMGKFDITDLRILIWLQFEFRIIDTCDGGKVVLSETRDGRCDRTYNVPDAQP